MHLPDHYLSPEICVASAAAAASGLAVGFWRFRGQSKPPATVFATAAAGIFAAQMVNFPVGGGTSGHLIGATLAAVLLGVWPAMVLMTVVLAVQCLLFADGGMAALGANILNMAVIAPFVGWNVYRLANGARTSLPRQMIAGALAAWASVVAAAAACSFELAASGTKPLGETLAAMISVHAIIGLGEALITAGVIALAARRAAIGESRLPRWVGLAAAMGIVVILAPFASSLPDGLEAVAERLRFHSGESPAAPTAVMPDYLVSGISSEAFATIAAGLIGLTACAILTWALSRATLVRHADSRS
jgi:cobalt/nickel transport system permease protein